MQLRRLSAIVLFSITMSAQDSVSRARQMESEGDPQGSLRLLQEAVEANPTLEANVAAYAEFLDRHGNADALNAYKKLLAANPSGQMKRTALRRMVTLATMAGDRESAARYLQDYRAAGGTVLPSQMPAPAKPENLPIAEIPGPLTSFSRMAALSPDLKPDDILPALARNVVTNGYQAANSQEALDQTEYLKLVFRYLSQARELDKLSGADKIIKIETCDSQQTGELLKILGYRMRGGCGSEVVLETVNASRAFLTIDSGFPLAELEQSLRTNRPFTYDFKPTRVPALYGSEYWLSGKEKQTGDFIEAFLSDPSLCRLYLGMSKLDHETALELKKAMPVTKLRAFAHVIDFFGGMFLIRNGKVQVPGGPKAAATWQELVGVSPDNGAQFIERLVARDDGWLNSYFDSLSRIEGPVLTYLTEGDRLKRFYNALRGKITSPGPARPVFRSNTDLMLLTTRLRIEPNGQPHIPGTLDVWKNLFINHPHGKYDGKLTKAASGWKSPDDLVEALFALCRKAVDNEPLKIYMALTDLNSRRTKPLEPATVDKLARSFRIYSSQYPVFNEIPTLSDAAIVHYLETAAGVTGIRDQALRADAAGTLQGLVGLWQIFTRNGSIPEAKAEQAFSTMLTGFAKPKDAEAVFMAGVAGARTLLQAAGAQPKSNPQDRMLDLLAGTTSPRDSEAHQQMIQDMMRIFEAQKLVSLKSLMDIADHLDAVAKGEKFNPALVSRMQTRMQEIQLPRASLTGVEKNAISFGYWVEKHIEAQRKISLRALLEKPGADAGRFANARAQLAPVLRDTLVGFNYIYYAPPGAQLLRTNPLFVRSHDFLGVQGTNQTWRHTEVLGSGWPSSAGGRLVGSLAGVPYALAEAEQNFLIPSREQALIWGDLVPQMILSAKIPRWWNVSPQQMHWVGLHLRAGESRLAEAAINPEARSAALAVIAKQAAPARVAKVSNLLNLGDYRSALDNVTSSELFALGGDAAANDKSDENPLAAEIRRLSAQSPQANSYAAISRAFGTPKPTLTTSFRPELLNLRTFPTLMGYSSRIMAESWESSILYYVALADEMLMSPGRLNVAIPEWTQQTVERIFATHLEDWPALLRSLRTIGDDVRARARKPATVQRAGGE
ncbi:MAG: hypothetical protein IT168_21015 [Bryobacterales bacterium]|nr:hypothetical protein [Bryobacterales bacterium]